MDLGPEKVTSTCPQRFAELDSDCFSRLLGVGKSFKGGAELATTAPPCSHPTPRAHHAPTSRGDVPARARMRLAR